MPDLVEPTTRLHTAFLTARDEWGPGTHEDGFGLHTDDDVDTPEGFAAWVRRVRLQADTTVPPDPGRRHCSSWWIVERDTVLGGIALRHGFDDVVLRLGHVGYGIRPSARGRGLATWALGQVLPRARELGMDRVLIACADDNVASARVIEANGGLLEHVRDTDLGRVRRYGIPLA